MPKTKLAKKRARSRRALQSNACLEDKGKDVDSKEEDNNSVRVVLPSNAAAAYSV